MKTKDTHTVPTFTLRIPADLKGRLNDYCDRRGKNRTETILKALEYFLQDEGH